MRTTTTVELEAETQQQLEQIAAKRHQSFGALLAEAVEDFIKREGLRAQFLQDGQDAMQHYQATGLHLTQDEVEVWLGQWERGEDLPLPECHT